MLHTLFQRLLGREDPILTRLASVPLFEDLSRRELCEIEQVMPRQSYGPGETIFEQGRPGVGMFVVLSGGVEIVQEDEDGARLKLAEIGDGAFFGEMALLDDAPWTASAVATEETEVTVFTRPDLLTLAEQRPHLGVKIVMHLSQIVAERLRRTNRALRETRDEVEAAQRESEADSDAQ